jgi:hypothetical protein
MDRIADPIESERDPSDRHAQTARRRDLIESGHRNERQDPLSLLLTGGRPGSGRNMPQVAHADQAANRLEGMRELRASFRIGA